jgi:spore germination cell wall hydrolase CwlJ-like protein
LDKLIAGQEKLTGPALMNKWKDQYWAANDMGPQKTPVEQGQPAMPDEKYYTTPQKRLPSINATQHRGEEVPSPIPGLMMMAGMGGGGGGLSKMGAMGLGMEINQQNRAANARAQQAALGQERKDMLADPANYPVQGYYTSLAPGSKIDPRTGLFYTEATGAYRGMPYQAGGRVGRAPGGRMQGPPMPYDPTDKDYLNLARTMHFEAGNQGDLGMLGVGHVARNRFESGKYGATPSDVVTAVNKRGVAQFTPWGTKGLGSNRPIERYQPTEHELALAKQALTESEDPTKGATHYYNPKISHPAWGKGMENQVQIGAHRFGTTAGGGFHGPQMMARGPVTTPATPQAQTQMASGPSTPTRAMPEYTPKEIQPKLAEMRAGSTPSGGLGDIATATPIEASPVVAADNGPHGFGDMAANDVSMPEIDIPGMAYGGRAEMRGGGVSINRSGGSTYGGTKYGVAELYDIMRQAGATPREAAQMAAVAMGESAGWSEAHNPNRKTGDDSYGLWQINMLGKLGPERMRKYGLQSVNDLANPVINARIALDLLRHGGGLRNWGAYNHPTAPYRNAVAQVNRIFPELAQRPVGFTPEADKRAVPYDPNARPLAFRPKEEPTVVAASPAPAGFGKIRAEDPSGPREGDTRQIDYGKISPPGGTSAFNQAAKNTGFSLIGSAQAADQGVYPVGVNQGPPMWGRSEAMKDLDLYQQPQGYMTFKRHPEWQSSKNATFVNRDMLDGTPETVSSKDMPMQMNPWGDTNINGPEEPVVAKEKPAASGQKYWGDYRDVENNPFGDFIDELAGDVRSSKKAGTAATPMGKFAGQGGLGQLFDLEGTLPYETEQAAPQGKAQAQNQDEGVDLGGLFNIFE